MVVVRVVEPKSERICRVPLAATNALMIAPFAAVRRRNRSTPEPADRFTFMLMHGVIVVVPRVTNADADWAVTCARALGSVGEPIEVSSVILVGVQLFRFVNSSAKIGGAANAAGDASTCNVAAIRTVRPRIEVAFRRALWCGRTLMSISCSVSAG